MFYATQLFAVLGQDAKASLLSTAIVGAVNVGSTIIAIILVDRLVHMSPYSVRRMCTATGYAVICFRTGIQTAMRRHCHLLYQHIVTVTHVNTLLSAWHLCDAALKRMAVIQQLSLALPLCMHC